MNTATSATSIQTGARWMLIGVGVAAAAYAALAATNWIRYGRVSRPESNDADALLDQFMRTYEVIELHHVTVKAPAAITFAAAKELSLDSAIARLLFNVRAMALGGAIDRQPPAPRRFVEQAQTIGWRVLAEVPDKEIVLGAITRPWEAAPVFRGVPPADFASFQEAGYVKIVFTLRADAIGPQTSIFRTETRACTTSGAARRKFRRYWALVEPGVGLIRLLMLGPVKCEAERRAKDAARNETLAELERMV